MCPKIKSTVQCKETCVYKDSFNFDENCIEDLPLPTTSSKKETQKVGSVLEDDTDSCQTEDGSTTTITQNSTLSDARNDKAVCQDSSLRLKEIRKHFHIEGSESGIFSGSGFCMEDTISNDGVLDYERKTSDIDRSKRTKEWIESHSKSKSFGISTQPGSAAHMSTDETTGVLQEEKGTFKKFTTPYLPHWYARN
ncbi:uncharacterized protein LOC128555261 [Mercenaria mercenaria]|uniref:uncharacterized protein LOC128555261 n=1 Tax=Mercenaria mercenaria TaxID=6596 RepID=UPI00234F122D|nr:uncharacterized protein LOC128555261 [Mercenaria mercenaria]